MAHSYACLYPPGSHKTARGFGFVQEIGFTSMIFSLILKKVVRAYELIHNKQRQRAVAAGLATSWFAVALVVRWLNICNRQSSQGEI